MNPLADAKVGEWVRYEAQLPGSEEKTTLKVRVVEVGNGEVRFDRELESGPAIPLPLPGAAPMAPLLEALAAMGRVEGHETRTADLKGQRVEIAIVTLEAFGGSLKMTFSNAVYGLGLLRVELGKVTVLEATEWGIDEVEAPEAAPTPAPEAKPAEAPKPTEAVEPPVASGPSDDTDGPEGDGPPNPLADAKVGEWVKLRTMIQGEEALAVLRVVEVGDENVRLESRIAYGDKEIQGAELTRPRRARLSLGGRGGRGEAEVGRETLEINGKRIDCITITRSFRGGRTDKRWISSEIPVDGLVRHERGGSVVRELLDWGTSGEPAPLR